MAKFVMFIKLVKFVKLYSEDFRMSEAILLIDPAFVLTP
jgi:hypothetical protein